MSKQWPNHLAIVDPDAPLEGEEPPPPPPPPPRDPKVPLTFDEMRFNVDDEIENEEVRNLNAHIMVKAAEVRQYLV